MSERFGNCPSHPHVRCMYCPHTEGGETQNAATRKVLEHVRSEHPQEWTEEDEAYYNSWVS